MADVNINKFRASVIRAGSTPAAPGFVVSEGQNPVDPAGSGQNHLPVTIGTPANGLAVTDAQVLTINKAQIFAGTASQFVKGDGTLDSTSYQPLLTNPVTGTGTTNVLPKFTGSTTIGDSVISDNSNEVTINKRVFVNNSVHSISFQPNNSGVSNRIESTNLPLEIITAGASLILAAGGVSPQISLASTGVVTLSNLAGSGTRMVVANASGVLSTQTIAANQVTGTGTTNYLPKFTGASTIGNSQVFDNGTNVGIGTAIPNQKLQVNSTTGDGVYISSFQTTTGAINTGSSLLFGFNDGVNNRDSGFIKALKENGTSGDFASYLSFATRPSGGSVTERIKVFSDGNTFIGNSPSNAGFKLDVNGRSRFVGSTGLPNTSGTSQNGTLRLQVAGYGTVLDFGAEGPGTGKQWIQVTDASDLAITYPLLLNPNGGNVGIGTATPSAELQVAKSSDVTIAMSNSSSVTSGNRGGIAWYNSSVSTVANIRAVAVTDNVGTELQFYTRPASGGLTQVFTIASTGAATFSSSIQIGPNDNGYLFVTNSAGNNAGTFRTSRAYTGGVGSFNDLAIASFGVINFFTNNSATPSATITSGGEVLVGTTTTDVNTQGCQLRPFGLGIFVRSGASTLQLNRLTSDGIIASFRTSDIERGSISISGATTSYNTTSDYRLKEDFKEIKGLEKVNSIKVYDYKWKSDNKRMDGVLAHELAEVLPYAVFGEKDELDEYGNNRMQSVDYSKIVPVMVKAIQELKQEIDTLKN